MRHKPNSFSTLDKEMASPSSSKLVQQVEQAKQHSNQTPQWLEVFLQRTFFDSCSVHPINKNELNRYCINCNLSACQYCISAGSHRQHKILKIYRLSFKDVVSLGAMEKHIDCSQIQPYKSNKRLVIALNPLPHSGTISSGGASCEICKRRLAEPDVYGYCSIACKVTAFSRKPSESVPPFLSLPTPTKEKRKKAPKPDSPKHKRKGKPCRAPLF